MDYQKRKIETLCIAEKIKISGYTGEYIFEKIKSTGEFYEQKLLDKWVSNCSEMKTIYDIGANIGNHTIYFASKSKAHIYAFEPMPMNFSLLKKNIYDNMLENQVSIYNVALGDQEGVVYMGLAQENNNGTAMILPSKNEESTEVKVIDLDSMHLPKPDFVKIDVEGFEINVLKGMKETLDHSNALIWVEVNEANACSVYNFMSELGYYVTDLDTTASNNILFTCNKDIRIPASKMFEYLLTEATAKRDNWIALGKQVSKFLYEQKKARDLQDKLKEISTKYTYEQKKARDLQDKLKEISTKYTYEQKKVQEFSDLLQDISRRYEHEQEKAKNLTEQILSLKNSNNKIENDLSDIKAKYQQSLNQIKDLSQKAEKMQKDLDMFNNSRMINFMRFWVWKVPKSFRRSVKKNVYKFGHWLYVRLIPYPRIRKICSKINGKLKIFKDPQAIVAPQQSLKKEKSIKEEKYKSFIKTPKQMNIAMIVDEFTYNSLRYECNALPLEPHNWKEIFDKNDIDLFFCESAWSGIDSNRRPWKGQIYSSIRFSKENRSVLLEILNYCREKGIPTAFWNKEDPTHYDDKIHNFVDTALKFDHIFTTSIECVERYKKEYGHKNVHLLMFATQPKLFNPIEKFDRTEEIVFAGSWYKQHKDRCLEMEQILDAILNSSYHLKIYNRQSDNPDPNHVFPDKYLPYVYPRLPHDQLDLAYKGSKYALNINTVTDSDTMFARRVFELMSSNTLVISNYSRGMELLFGDNIIFTDGKEPIDLSHADEKREKCLNLVLQQHTYKKRMEQILNDIGIPFVNYIPQVTIIYEVSNFETAHESVNNFHQIDWINKKCILVVEEICSPATLQEICLKFNCGMISVISKHYYNYYDKNSIQLSDNGYVIIADEKLEYDFISNALLHYQYLDKDTPIAKDVKKFVFNTIYKVKNALLPVKLFQNVMENYDEFEKIIVYSI